MEAGPLSKTAVQPEQRAINQKAEKTEENKGSGAGDKRAESGGSLPEDRISLSRKALDVSAGLKNPSEPVTSREKAALIGSQKVRRFSVYG